jgi:predicted Na+-dependent transporter
VGRVTISHMDEEAGSSKREILKKISMAFLMFMVFGVGIPLFIGALVGISSAEVFTMITSTLVLQAAAPPIGLAMGLSPAAILVIMGFFALGILLAIFAICDSLAASSKRVRGWIDRLKIKTDKYPAIQKYGAISCMCIAWIPGVGLYGTPVIAWIMKWKRVPSIIFTLTGFLIAAIFVLFFASRINEVLLFVATVGVLIFIITSMFTLGFSLTIPQILESMQHKKIIILALVTNFILVPLVAYLVVNGLPLPQGIAIGMILTGLAAGSPFLPRIVQVGNENRVLAGALAVILMILTAFYLPLVLPLLVPSGVAVDPARIFVVLVLLMLVPLGIALFIRSKKEARAVRLTPWLSKISYIAFIASFVAVLLVYYQEIPDMIGTGGTIAAVIFILAAFAIGYICGWGSTGTRSVLAFGTAQRNLAVAAVIASLGFAERSVLIMVLTMGVIGLLLLWVIGRWQGKARG